MSIVISTIRRKVLRLLLRAVFMQFCDHSTITPSWLSDRYEFA